MKNIRNVSVVDFVAVVNETLVSDGFSLNGMDMSLSDNSLIILDVVSKDGLKASVPCIFESDMVLDIVNTVRQSIINFYTSIAYSLITSNVMQMAA